MENKYITNDYNKTKEKQSLAKTGNLNPMYSQHHTEISKHKISQSQKKRWDNIRKAVTEEQDFTDAEARQDLINQALYTDTISFKDIQQAHNFFSIISGQNQKKELKYLIQKTINDMLKDYIQHVQ